jgi:hypothetical protein
MFWPQNAHRDNPFLGNGWYRPALGQETPCPPGMTQDPGTGQ